MTLEEFALKLKAEYKSTPTPLKAEQIANKIKMATINNRPLNSEEINKIIFIFENDFLNGKVILLNSDNSAWLTAVTVLKEKIRETK